MTVFIYSAADKSGKTSKGEREAPDQKTLAQSLKSEGLLLLDASEKKGIGSLARLDIGQTLARFRPVPLEEKMFFARNLSVMISAGMSLNRALEALAQETGNPKFKKVIEGIGSSIAQGTSLAEALRVHRAVFGELFSNMVEVGEATGKLSLVLKRLANQMNKDHALRKRVKGALIYPAVILTALGGVGALMMIYVVPTLTKVLTELGVPLPLSTRIIIAVSNFMVSYGIFLPFLIAGLIAGFWRLLKIPRGKEIVDRVTLKIPVFGPLIQKFNVARFCRTLAYLIMSGVPIVRSLDITASVLGNTGFRTATAEAAQGIQTGKQLYEVLAAHPKAFHGIVIQMIQVGEETGRLSGMLLRVALFFEEEVANTTKNMSTIIEPVLMIVIGVVVGVFAVSVLQPIYTSLGNV